MFLCITRCLTAAAHLFFLISCALCISQALGFRGHPRRLTYIWPLPAEFTYGNKALSVNPALSLAVAGGNGGSSAMVRAAFGRYKGIIFKHISSHSFGSSRKLRELAYDIAKLNITVHSKSEELQLGVDESYTLLVSNDKGLSTPGEVTIEANTVYGALRALEEWRRVPGRDGVKKEI